MACVCYSHMSQHMTSMHNMVKRSVNVHVYHIVRTYVRIYITYTVLLYMHEYTKIPRCYDTER